MLEWQIVLSILFGSMLFLMFIGIPVAFVFMIVALISAAIFWNGEPGIRLFVLNMYASIAHFYLLPLPMFVFLGEVVFHSGMGFKIFDVADQWLGRLPGRLSVIAVSWATLFAAMTGNSIATVGMLGTVLLPEMEKRGYKKVMSIGPIIGSGALAMVIPPSGIAVLIGAVGEISIGKLLISGIIPGLIISAFYIGYITIRCRLQPSLAPPYEVSIKLFSKKIIDTVFYVLPLGLIIFSVLGLILIGIATPTEAAVMGAISSLILAACYGRLNWEVLKKSIVGTVHVSVMALMIIVGAMTYSQILAFSGASQNLTKFAISLPLPPVLIMISMQLVVVILGCLMDIVAIIMITLPIFMPCVRALGFDPVWFGLVMLINLDLAMITPPFGMNLFVMRGIATPGTTMADIWKAGIPFCFIDLLSIALFIAFPPLVLWLPSMMK
jgi:tripartite ATP-independent transporter DctM subunit